MAYTSIIPVHRLDNSVDYVLDEKKTSRSQNAGSLQAAVDYALNKDKTEQDLFCSAIGCTLDSSFEDMCQVKRMWHKEKGVQGFHLVQSFAAGEVTPELAHQIGRELAERLLDGKFQVVISTHLNTGHLHNHLVCIWTLILGGSSGRIILCSSWSGAFNLSRNVRKKGFPSEAGNFTGY